MTGGQINQIIQGIGLMTEMYTITYQSFKKQGLGDEEAIKHTKAFISVMMDSIVDTSGKDTKQGGAD
jgi:hypothetical protein